MISQTSLFVAALIASGNMLPTHNQGATSIAPSAQVQAPPSASKRRLIRRFLILTGKQAELDNGSFLARHALPGGPLWQTPGAARTDERLDLAMGRGFAALRQAYAKHKATFQSEYESHLNWEFTEAELAEIVAFLDRPAGKHYLDGVWRMNAYVGTNTEDLEAEILKEAAAQLAKR